MIDHYLFFIRISNNLYLRRFLQNVFGGVDKLTLTVLSDKLTLTALPDKLTPTSSTLNTPERHPEPVEG